VNKCLVCQFIMLVIIVVLCTGCSKKEEDTMLLPVESDFIQYDVKNLSAYTVDEEGALYTTASSILNEDNTFDSKPTFDTIPTYIHKYDLEGNLIFSHEFDDSINYINGMAVNGNKVYFTISGSNKEGVCSILYSYDIGANILEHLYDFNYFESARQLIYLEDRVYVLGNNPYSTSSTTNKSEDAYQSKGEKLVYYSLSDKMVYELGVNIPISMALNEDGTLMINGYLDKEGYCMLQYEPKKDSIKVVANFDSGKFENFAVCDYGKKVIYTYDTNSRGLVMSDVSAIEEESEIYADATCFSNGIYYIKGQVYCTTYSGDLVRFTLNTVQKENRTIRYISPGFQADEPFGCGYSMKRTELEEDKFALKVLAQDKDYDLLLMNSSSYSSYNIRKNGVFYPLNNVEGITEYLDSCFPYVKEAATDEDGNIWMLPIAVDIQGLLVNEESLAKDHIALKDNMTYEEFYQVQEGMTEELYKKANCNSYVIYLSFFAQYFNKQMDLKDGVFRSKLELFQKYDSHMPSLLDSKIDLNGDFLYEYLMQSSSYELFLNQIYDDHDLSVYSMPKLNATDKNSGTCTYLAVNANAKNRKETLAYLADWIKYCMRQEKVPLYFQQPVPEDDTLRGSLYELYENGEITFYIDRDVYVDGFFNVIENGGNTEDYIKETGRKLDAYFNE